MLDAGALGCLAEPAGPLGRHGGRLVITPHAGEMAHLLGRDATRSRPTRPAPRARQRASCMRRGAEGRPDPHSESARRGLAVRGGTVGLATSGSGDVLAASSPACSRAAPTGWAAVWGVFLHGEAGTRLARRGRDRLPGARNPGRGAAHHGRVRTVRGLTPSATRRMLLRGGTDARRPARPAWYPGLLPTRPPRRARDRRAEGIWFEDIGRPALPRCLVRAGRLQLGHGNKRVLAAMRGRPRGRLRLPDAMGEEANIPLRRSSPTSPAPGFERASSSPAGPRRSRRR